MAAPGTPTPATSPAARRFRVFSSLAFSFAWIPVMYTAFTRDRGFSPDEYQRLWSVYYLCMVVAELPWGWVADRFGKRPLLVCGPLVLAGGFAILGHASSLTACLAAMALTGAGHAMISGADSAWLYELVVSEGRPQDALREESAAYLWRLGGVSLADLLGGFVAHHGGTSLAFDLSVVLMLGAAAAAAGLPSLHTRPAPDDAARPHLRVAVGSLRRPDLLWVVAWFGVVFVLVRVGFQLYQPTLLAAGFEDLRGHGGLFSLLNVLAAGAALTVARCHDRLGERATAAAVLLLLTVSFAGLSRAGPGAIVPLLCLQQIAFAYLQPVGRTALNTRIDTRHRASLLSAQSMLARLGFGAVLWFGQWDDALDTSLAATWGTLAWVALGAALLLTWGHVASPSRRRA